MTNNFRDNRRVEAQPLPELPKGYLQNGYEIPNVRLITGTAIEIAKDLTVAEEVNRQRRKNSVSGVRKFYDYLVNNYDSYNRKAITESELLYKIGQLKAHVDYSYSKKLCTVYFVKFIKANVTACKTAEDVKAFKEHFMAVYEEFNAVSK